MNLKLKKKDNVVNSLVMFLKLPFVVSSVSDAETVEFDICNLFSISKRLVCVISIVLVSCIKVVVCFDSVSLTTGTKVLSVLGTLS